MKTPAATPDFTAEFNAENFQRLIVLQQENLHIVAALQSQVKALTHQVEWFKRQLFGQKSEQRDFSDHPYQTTIADLLNDLPAVAAPAEEAKQTLTFQRGKAKKNALDGAVEETGLRFDDSVPVEEIVLPCPELEGPDKDDYEVIDNKITHRLAQNSASFVVLKYIRPVVKKKSTQAIVSVAAPANVLEKSIADVSFLTGLLVDKFVYHLPLYRQHERLEQNGILLARSTLTNLVKRAIALLKPIYRSQLENILLSKLLAIDETPIKAGKEKKGTLKQGYFWPIYGDCAEICFTFSGSRSMSHLKTTLGEFNGTILSDGYKAYECYAETVNSTTHALCWVHMRRGFEKAEKSEPQACAEAMAMIGLLYQHEEAIRTKGLTGKEKLDYRKEKSQLIVDQFFNWLHTQRQRIDLAPSDPFSKALIYAQSREQGLREFLCNPDLPMDTNHLERALRCIPMGKKNWLFCWTEIGAEDVGVIQSLLTTCKLHDVNPYDYLVDVLQRVGQHPASRVHELTPRLWKEHFADNPLRSDLYRRNYNII